MRFSSYFDACTKSSSYRVSRSCQALEKRLVHEKLFVGCISIGWHTFLSEKAHQLARKFLCRGISVKNASFERARKAGYDGLVFPRTYSQVPSKKIQNTFPTMYTQEKLSFYSSLSTIFFRSLVSIFPLTRTWTYVDDYTKSVFLVVLLEKNHMSIRLIVLNVLHSPKHIGKNLLASGITSCSQMKANLTYLDQMGKLWFGECQRKSSIQNALFQL